MSFEEVENFKFWGWVWDRICSIPPSHDTIEDRVLFSIDFFVSLFVSLSARLRENGRTDLHEIFGEGVVVWSHHGST